MGLRMRQIDRECLSDQIFLIKKELEKVKSEMRRMEDFEEKWMTDYENIDYLRDYESELTAEYFLKIAKMEDAKRFKGKN